MQVLLDICRRIYLFRIFKFAAGKQADDKLIFVDILS